MFTLNVKYDLNFIFFSTSGKIRLRSKTVQNKTENLTVGRFYNIVGFILAFGSPFYKPVPKGGSVNIFSGNIFDTNIHFERVFVNIKHN